MSHATSDADALSAVGPSSRRRAVVPEESGQARSRSSTVLTLVLIGVLALFAAVVWNAYREQPQLAEDGSLRIVRAAPGPIKTYADGETESSEERRLIVERVIAGDDEPEREVLLAPPSETYQPPVPDEPVVREARDDASADGARPTDEPVIADRVARSDGDGAVSPPAPAVPGGAGDLGRPTLEEVIARLDAGGAAALQTPPPTPPATIDSLENAPDALDLDDDAPDDAAPAAPVSAAPAAFAVSPGGSHRVQLAAVRERASIDPEWLRLQRRHSDLLGDLELNVRESSQGGAAVYRLQVGPFVDKATASRLCDALQAEGQGCFLVGQ